MKPKRGFSVLARLLAAVPANYALQRVANSAILRHERRMADIIESGIPPTRQLEAIRESRDLLHYEIMQLVPNHLIREIDAETPLPVRKVPPGKTQW